MNNPNKCNSFTTNISTYFYENGWSTNIVENTVTFRGTGHCTMHFLHGAVLPLVLEGPVVVTFTMPLIIYHNPFSRLMSPPIW